MAPTNTPTAKAASSGQYVDYDEFVDYQLEKARGTIKTTEIVTTITSLAAGIVAYLLVFVVLDQWVIDGGFSAAARLIMLILAGGSACYVFLRHVLWPTLRKIHPLYAARVIERADPKLKSTLLNFVDLRESEMRAAPGVLRAIERRAAVELDRIDVDEAVDRKTLLRVAYTLLTVVTIAAFYLVFSPKDPFASVRRALFPIASIAPATETVISDVTPGDDKVPARTLLTIEADVRGKPAEQVRILYTTADHKYVDQPVQMHRIDPELPRYRGVLNGENGRGLLQDLSYTLVAGDARTREYRVEVVQPPSAQVTSVHYEFPKYMQLEPRTTTGGAIDGWEGVKVTVTAEANMPIKQARLVLTDTNDPSAKGEEVSMQIAEGTKLSATWRLEFRSDGTYARHYHVRVATEKGESDPEPATYPVRIRPDQRPEVALLFPTGDLEKPANAIVPLHIVASDPDFLLRSITLKCEKNGEELPDERLFEEQEPLGQSLRGTHEMRLARLRLQPGDRLQYWVEAKDNKQPMANRGSTPRMNITILAPESANEVAKQLAQDQEQLKNQLAQAPDDRNAERPGQAASPDEPAPEDSGQEPQQGDPRRDDRIAAQPADQQDKSGDSDANPPAAQNLTERPADRQAELQRRIQKLLDRDQRELKEAHAKDQPEEERAEPAEQDNTGDAAPNDAPRQGGKRPGGKKPGQGKQGAKPADAPQDNADPGQSEGEEGSDAPQEASSPKEGQRGNAARPQNKGSGNNKTPESKNRQSEEGHSDAPNDAQEGADAEIGNQDAADDKEPSGGHSRKPGNNEQNKGPGQRGNKPDDGLKTQPNDDPGDEPGSEQPSERGETQPARKSGPGSKNQKADNDGKRGQNQSGAKDGADQQSEVDKPSDAGRNDKVTDARGAGKQAQRGKPGENELPGPARGGEKRPSNRPPEENAGAEENSQEAPDGGKREPAKGSPDAPKDPSSQSPPGKAEGSDQQDPDAPKAPEGVKRRPGAKPGATQPREEESADDPQPQAGRRGSKPDSGNRTSSSDPKQGQPAPMGKQPSEKPGQTEDDPSASTQQGSKKPGSKRPSDPPELGNQPRDGEGRKQGQNSDQAQGGEEGSSGASDNGQAGGNTEGAGDMGDEAGHQQPSGSPTGRSGGEKGQGSGKSSPGNEANQTDQPDSETSEAGNGKKGGKNGGSGGKESAGGGGKSSSGQPRAGSPGSSGNSAVGGGVSDLGQGGGTGRKAPDDDDADHRAPRSAGSPEVEPSPEELDEARLENARKATNLVLRKLKQKLERGEVDEELMQDLGWKDLKDLEKFVTQLEESLGDKRDDESAEALARRKQFEELLKSLRLGSETANREGGKTPERRIQQIDARRRPPPQELRELYEAYTKGLAKEKPAPKKSAPQKP